MNGINERIARLEQAIEDLKNNGIREIKNKLDDLTKAITNMSERMAKLESKIENVPDESEVNAIKQKLDDHLETHRRFWVIVGTIATVLMVLITIAGMMLR